MKPVMTIIAVLAFLSFSNNTEAQGFPLKRIGVAEAISMAKRNMQYEVNELQINKSRLQIKTAGGLPKTGVFAENEDMRPGDSKGIFKLGLSQNIAWPGVYKARKTLYNEQLKYFQSGSLAIDADMKRDVRTVYYRLWYLQDKQQLFYRLDSIYSSLNQAARLKVKTGDSPGIDSIAANVRMKELQALLQQVTNDIQIQQQLLKQLLNTNEMILPAMLMLEKLPVPVGGRDSLHPVLELQKQNINISNAGISVTRNENRPEFSGRFFSQRLYGLSDPYTGFSLTASIPLFGAGAYTNKVRTAQAEAALQQKQYEYGTQLFNTQRSQAQAEVQKNNSMLSFYETTGLMQAEEIIKAASLAYRAGEISFAELTQYLTQAIDIQRNYLEKLNEYNQSVIQYYYFINL